MTRAVPCRAALAAVLLLALAGCATARQGAPVPRPSASDPLPTTAVTAPSGVSTTAAGTGLAFGEPGVVGFTQNAQRRTTLQLTVTGARRGRPADLSAYSLDEQARASRPFYVDVSVANLGPGDVGRAAVPLTVIGSDGSVTGVAGFTTPLPQCASSGPPGALPTSFPARARTTTCLVFLLPRGVRLQQVAFRPSSGQQITWSGTVRGGSRAGAAAR